MTPRGGATRRPALLGIDHVQLAMPAGPAAEAEAERFYVSLLGFERQPKPAPLADRGGCWFRTTTVQLHLGVEEPFRPARKAHPALLVDDLDPLAERLASADVPVRPAEPVDGRRRAHVEDPFGNWIELVEAHGPSPEVFRTIADSAVNPFCLIGQDGTLEWVSASIEPLLGWTPDEVVSRSLDELISPGSLPDVIEGLSGLNEVPSDYPRAGVGVAADLLRSDGSSTPVDLIAAAAQLTGLPWHIVFAQRTGYQRALDRALQAIAENAELHDVLTHLGAAMEQAIPSSSVAVCDRWRAPRFRIAAGSAVDLLPPAEDAPWARAVATGEDVWAASPDDLPPALRPWARDRGLASCWVHPVTVTGEPAPVAALVIWRALAGTPSPFTWRAVERTGQLLRLTLQWDRSHRALEYAATHDTLTGVANRKAFLDRLDDVAKAGAGRSAVLFIDLNGLKPVNERHGHPAGDRVVAEVARRLAGAVRPGDLVARVGGDEFAVLCERLGRPEDAEAVADRLLDVIRQPLSLALAAGEPVTLGASIGLAELVGGQSPEMVISRADEALREAKSLGRGRWVRHPPPG
ncbi:MAG TPA: diguanylate cyclase [Acidimicrobiales bacterium]|nr:diguanylate cyclase [Acidimicrobiales bacterium]